MGGVPPVSNSGLPTVTQPSVYFGLNNSGYVVANTKQPEIDYQLTNGTNVETHYKGDGGVQLSNFFDQAMFAIRFSDFNLLISNQITSQSRLMFDRGVQARVTKAAPFLSLDADPYPVLLNGQIDWVQDAYTTTDNYPYAQNADTSALPQGSGLNQNFNYVRNSVKVLINAYTGKMTFYVMDPNDPIIQTYEKAFPGMFTPASKMSAELQRPPPVPRGHLHRAGHHVRQVPHHQRPELLQRRRRLDAVALARLGLAVAGAADHPDHQRPGPAGLHRPAGADGPDLPGAAGAGPDPAVVQPARRLRAGIGAEPDPDPVRVHDRRAPTRVTTDSSRCSSRPGTNRSTARPSWRPRSMPPRRSPSRSPCSTRTARRRCWATC